MTKAKTNIMTIVLERRSAFGLEPSTHCLSEERVRPGNRTEALPRQRAANRPGGYLSIGRREVLETLLASTSSHGSVEGGLQALWAAEAMQRSYAVLCLVRSLEMVKPLGEVDISRREAECLSARNLASVWTAASRLNSDARLDCAEAMEAAARSIVELFGRALPDIELEVIISSVSLQSLKARALILLTSELVINAIRHGFKGATFGVITVVLESVGGGNMRLIVADNGSGFRDDQPGSSSLVWDMALILEGDLELTSQPTSGACVALTFPVS